MRYIADSNGCLKEVSFGADISCNGQSCTLYTGDTPAGYNNLMDWFVAECGNLYRWSIVEGQLTKVDNIPAPVMPEPCRPLSMTKVWENEDPSQAVGKQTLEVDLSAFQMVAIEYQFNTTTPRTKIAFGVIGSQVTLDFISKEFNMGLRICVPYANKVEIQAAAYSASSADPDNYMIPTRIFGIKGIAGMTGNVETHAICGLFLCGGAACGQ